MILLADPGTGKMFATTDSGRIIPTVFGRMAGDVVGAEWTTIALDVKEFGVSGEYLFWKSHCRQVQFDIGLDNNEISEHKSSTGCHTMFKLQLQRPENRVHITMCVTAGYEGPFQHPFCIVNIRRQTTICQRGADSSRTLFAATALPKARFVNPNSHAVDRHV